MSAGRHPMDLPQDLKLGRAGKNGEGMKKYCNAAALFFLFICVPACSCRGDKKMNKVCFKGRCVNVEIVEKQEDLRQGLQFRKFLEHDAGMFFILHESKRHSFWMKDTLIPLDIIWIDKEQKVVHISADTPPCKKGPCPIFTPLTPASYVLEVNAGYAAVLGAQAGDVVEFRK